MQTTSVLLAWGDISWTEEPGGLQSMGPQKGRHHLGLNNSSSSGTDNTAGLAVF